jgi:hypothetical protein
MAETNRIQLVLSVMQNRTCGAYLAAIYGIIILWTAPCNSGIGSHARPPNEIQQG